MKKEHVNAVLVMLVLLSILLGFSTVADAKDRPLPYTINNPHIVISHKKGGLVEWYNTKPGVYTVWSKYERCTPKFCLIGVRIVWRKYVGIGNVRVTDKHKDVGSYWIR